MVIAMPQPFSRVLSTASGREDPGGCFPARGVSLRCCKVKMERVGGNLAILSGFWGDGCAMLDGLSENGGRIQIPALILPCLPSLPSLPMPPMPPIPLLPLLPPPLILLSMIVLVPIQLHSLIGNEVLFILFVQDPASPDLLPVLWKIAGIQKRHYWLNWYPKAA